MPEDTPTGETAPAQAPSNNVAPPAAPPANAVDPAEVERLRKDKEQQDLRIRQLENEKATALKAEEERKAKELESQNEFKTLYEQEKEAREKAEGEKAATERLVAVKAETDKLLTDYSPEVRKLVETTGLTLSDTDETTVNAFKAKLEEIKSTVGTPRVAPNNPGQQAPTPPSFANPETGIVEHELKGAKFDEIARSMPGIASMMEPPQE